MLCGNPDEVCEQISAWGDVGMDQLVFGLPIEGMHDEEILATLELFGDQVIPEFDKDRTHSTDYYRATGQAEVRRSSPTRCRPTSSGRPCCRRAPASSWASGSLRSRSVGDLTDLSRAGPRGLGRGSSC